MKDKIIWDMRLKDVLSALMKYWLVIVLAAVTAGGIMFFVNYYNRIVKKDYVSSIQYTFIYSVKVYDTTNNTEYWKLSSPTEYINVYKNALTNEEVYAEAARLLRSYEDETLRFGVRELQSMTRVVQEGNILTIKVTTKNSSAAQKVLTQLVKVAEMSVEPVIEQMQNAELSSAKLSVQKRPSLPSAGTIYEKEGSLVKIVLNALLVLAVVAIAVAAAVVILCNFNGRFKRRDVFECNYEIAVLGEVPVKIDRNTKEEKSI